ncbi:hypothetical protein ATANTOWER_019823, partial [Ataeniobius toweri]|nr:hypothetical protein [Ataeniobius toweri]
DAEDGLHGVCRSAVLPRGQVPGWYITSKSTCADSQSSPPCRGSYEQSWVRLEPKGKYYNAFIQEVGTHSTAVTVFIEELGEKHLVPLTDLKPVNPVPAWNVAVPARKGDLDPESRGQRHHRHRYFRKSRGSSGVKGAELLMPPPVSYGGPAPSSLPPRFQSAGHPRPPLPPSPGAIAYDPYAPPHHHPPAARAPRYGVSSSARFLNRQLIGPQLTYYHPSRRYYHDYENYAFKSRRSRRHLVAVNKDSQFGFPAETVEEPADLDPPIAYYQLDDASEAVFPAMPVRNQKHLSLQNRVAFQLRTISGWMLELPLLIFCWSHQVFKGKHLS